MEEDQGRSFPNYICIVHFLEDRATLSISYTALMSKKVDLSPPEKSKRVDEILSKAYGSAEWSPNLDPISELVLTILSQHTSDSNSGKAFDKLHDRFQGDWNHVIAAPTEEVIGAIRPAGLANVKAPRIQKVLEEVRERIGNFDLNFLADMPVPEARQWLLSLDGVGPKTAACVLMFSLGMPAMPVDTHVHRVSRRLGLIEDKVNAEKAHKKLAEFVPDDRVYAFHINLIRHGRTICKAQRPRCHECVVSDYCRYFQEQKTAS